MKAPRAMKCSMGKHLRRRQADYAWTVLARVLSWGVNRGLVAANPCERGGRLYRGGARAENIWTSADEAAFLQRAPGALASRAHDRAVDRPAARRSSALAMVGLRRHSHSVASVEDRRSCSDPGRLAAQSCARCDTQAQPNYPDEQKRRTMDVRRIPRVLGQSLQDGRRQWRDLPRLARHVCHTLGARGLHRS
jgi:hypothetical protein